MFKFLKFSYGLEQNVSLIKAKQNLSESAGFVEYSHLVMIFHISSGLRSKILLSVNKTLGGQNIYVRSEQRLSHKVQANKRMTAANDIKIFNQGKGKMHHNIVYQPLLCMALHSHRPVQVSMLTNAICQNHIQWVHKQ